MADGMGGSLNRDSSGFSGPGDSDERVWMPAEGPTEGPADGENATHYYFPVEIEVRTEAANVDTDAIVAETLRRLTEGLRSV